jgi:glycosyltransferase involved in cell wall biosynthesis
MSKQRLLFIINDTAFFLSHRLPLAIAAKEKGYEVHVAAPIGKSVAEIEEAGLIYHSIPLSRRGKNPFQELKSMRAMLCLMQNLKPDLVHLVTIKPILYGGLMARVLKIPAVVAAVSGLGSVFTTQTLRSKILRTGIKRLYRLALKHPNLKVIFQNEDDRQLLLHNKTFKESQTVLVRGSGVDMNAYKAHPENQDATPIVVMISRLLKDKGVLEYIAAAKMLKANKLNAEFLLIGESDYGNPAYIHDDLLTLWRSEGAVELLGFRKDIAQLMEKANLVVLPSYREGLPKVLIEAAACGRAVITTDVPGCRDAIEPNKTGLLVPVRDPKALAQAIEHLINNPNQRQEYGKAGRDLAEREFAIEHIVSAHMQVYQELGVN